MKKVKTVLDRQPISSDQIHSKQDFGKVMAGYKALKPPVWNSLWFYGTTGLATIAIVATAVLYNPDQQTTDENSLKATSTVMNPQKDHDTPPEKMSFIAQNDPQESFPTNQQKEKVNVTTPDESSVTVADNRPETEVQIAPPPPQRRRRPVSNTGTNMMPHIGNVFFGNIPYTELCNQNGIQCNNDLAIISFTVQYYNGRESIEKSVKGNVIPLELCENITKTSMGNEVFITQIRAEHRVSGRVTNLSSMNLVPTNP